MIEKYQALKAAALAAYPDRWIVGAEDRLANGNLAGVYVSEPYNGGEGGRVLECFANCLVTTDEQVKANAAFVAQADPATVLELVDENQYMRVKIKEMDLLFGGMLLTMQAAVIELEHGEGPATAMQWIFNKLLGPGEFAPDSEKDAQAYFNRKSEEIDAEFAKCQEFYQQRREKLTARQSTGGKS